MAKTLLLRLALPLLLLSCAMLWVGQRWPAQGFFLNLATELLGIIVTVAYVDWVIKAHERDAWKGTEERIGGRLRFLSNATITGLRTSLGVSADVLDLPRTEPFDERRASAEVMRVGLHVLLPMLGARLSQLDVRGWKSLSAHLLDTWGAADRLLNQFGHRLDPKDVELLLDLQQGINGSLTFWRTFPDIAGVPDADLPKGLTDPVGLKRAWTEITAADLAKVIRVANAISERHRG